MMGKTYRPGCVAGYCLTQSGRGALGLKSRVLNMSQPNTVANRNAEHALRCLSIVIPARDEEGCIASTVRHLNLELSLHDVPHEIIVVDDGSSDGTWSILQEIR